MNQEFITKWIEKDEWSLHEAAILLYGYDPDEWNVFYPKDINNVSASGFYVNGTRSLKRITVLLEELHSFLHFLFDPLVWKASPINVMKWANKSGDNFYFDGFIYQYALNNFTYDSSDDGCGLSNWYKELMRQDLWPQSDVANLITYCPQDLGCRWDKEEKNLSWYYPENPIRREIITNLCLAVEAGVLKSHKINIHIKNISPKEVYLNPREVVKWLKQKGYRLPSGLLETMESESNPMGEEPSKKTRGNQLDKLRCQAIAQTLWDEYPHMTIEKMKQHHAIREYGNGKAYGGKNTLRDWLSEVDPRPDKMKRGKNKKKVIPVLEK